MVNNNSFILLFYDVKMWLKSCNLSKVKSKASSSSIPHHKQIGQYVLEGSLLSHSCRCCQIILHSTVVMSVPSLPKLKLERSGQTPVIWEHLAFILWRNKLFVLYEMSQRLKLGKCFQHLWHSRKLRFIWKSRSGR